MEDDSKCSGLFEKAIEHIFLQVHQQDHQAVGLIPNGIGGWKRDPLRSISVGMTPVVTSAWIEISRDEPVIEKKDSLVEKEQSSWPILRRLRSMDVKLRREYEKIKLIKTRKKLESHTEIPARNARIIEKNDEIVGMKKQKKNLEQLIANLKTKNQKGREKSLITKLKEKLILLEDAMKAYENEIFELEKEIYELLKTILNMQVKEETLKYLLAEADLSMIKVESALKKGEHDSALAEYELFKAELERQYPSVAANQV